MIGDGFRARVFRPLAIVALAFAVASCGEADAPREYGYVSLERAGAVVEIDAESGEVVRRIEVGTRPRGIAITNDGSKLLVAVSGSPIGGPGVDEESQPPADHARDGVVIVDLASGRIVRRLEVGTDPETFALSPDGSTLYVSNEDRGSVSSVRLDGSRPPRTVNVGDEPEGVALSGDGRNLFVACEASDEIVLLDAQTMAIIKRIAITGRPRTLLTSIDGTVIYASLETGGAIATLSAADGTILSQFDIAAGDSMIRPMGLAQADAGTLFVTTGRGGTVLAVDPSQELVTAHYAVGERPWGIGMTSTRRLITANGPSNDVSVIDAQSGQLIYTIPVGGSPWGVAIAPTRPLKTSKP